MCELELKNRLRKESCTRSRQEIEELRRRCNKGDNTLTQHRLDEHSLQQKSDPDAVSQHMTQFKDFQDKVNFLSDARECHALDSRSSSGRSHVPNQPRVVSSSTRQPSRDSGGREIHEMIWAFEVTFLKTYLLKYIPKNSSKFKEFGDIIFEDNLWPRYQYVVFRREPDVKVMKVEKYHSLMTGVQNHAGESGTKSQIGIMNLLSGISNTRDASRHIPRPYGSPKLESKRSCLDEVVCWLCYFDSLDPLHGETRILCFRAYFCSENCGTEPISQIMMSWMRWWRLHWESFTIIKLTSERKCWRATCSK